MQIVSNPYSTQINPGGASAANAVNGIASAFLDTATPALRAAALAAQQRELAAKSGVASAFAGIAHGQQPDAAQFASDQLFGNVAPDQLSSMARNLATYTAGNGAGSQFAQNADRTAPNYKNTPTGAADEAALNLHNLLTSQKANTDNAEQIIVKPNGAPGISTFGEARAAGATPALDKGHVEGLVAQRAFLPGAPAGAPLNISPSAQGAAAPAIPPVAPAPAGTLSAAASNFIGAGDPGRGQGINWEAPGPNGTTIHGVSGDIRRDLDSGRIPANAQFRANLPGNPLGSEHGIDQLAKKYTEIQSGTIPSYMAVQRMKDDVAKGMFSGAGADHLEPFMAAMAQMGFGDPSKTANTQDFLNNATAAYVAAAKSEFGSRITNADLGVAQTGQGLAITNMNTVIQRALAVREALLKREVDQHNAFVNNYSSVFPDMSRAASIYRVQLPEPGSPGMQGAPGSAPAAVPGAPAPQAGAPAQKALNYNLATGKFE